MRVAFFDTHRFEKTYYAQAAKPLAIRFLEHRLTEETVLSAQGHECACIFVNDRANAPILEALARGGTRLIACRSAGFNHVDLEAAGRLGIRVVRVPEYSPYAVAEHAVALILSLNRKIHRSYNRVREGNFSLDGLVGFDLHGKTVGIIGTGKIGRTLCRILHGFGCNVLAQDLEPDASTGASYVPFETLLERSDILSLHVPLTPQTRHLIDAKAIARMKEGVMLINTSRGALVDTRALIAGLKSGKIGSAGLDVYEEEEGIFFEDLSGAVLQDDDLARLLTFPNVLLTSHQAFLTREALTNIAQTTIGNIEAFLRGEYPNEVRASSHLRKS